MFDLPAELDDDFWSQLNGFSMPTTLTPPNVGTGNLSSTTSSIRSPFPVSPAFTPGDSDFHEAYSLDATESELLSHYLSHSARAFAYDTDDLYALQIGYPSLAFRSGLIMKSMLALAAVCRCHDVLLKNRVGEAGDKVHLSDDDVKEMQELLALADRYHNESLSQTQAEITGASYYQFALANAPLMTLYGLASQSIRIQFIDQSAEVAQRGALPSEFTPSHSPLISLIRAAHEANSGISMDSRTLMHHIADFANGNLMAASPPSLGGGSTPDASVIGYDGRSSRHTKQWLLPIVSATCSRAFDGIRNRALAMHSTLPSRTSFVSPDASLTERNEIQACLAALDVLKEIATRVCGDGPSVGRSPAQTTPGTFARPMVALPSWLQDYLARVTSATPSQASHRTITSFVNRVPAVFLGIVQDVLAVVPVETAVTGVWHGGQLSLVQQLAMDVLAHWLVFVVLLDDIWWIGEIGGWELRRVSAVMNSVGWAAGEDPEWWPASMCRIRNEVEKHR